MKKSETMKFMVMLAVALCAVTVWAKVKVETDHESAIYRCGDVAKFTVTVTEDKTGALLTNGMVSATVDNFGTNVILREKFDLRKENPFTVKASRDTAGFLRLSLGGAVWGMWSVGFEPERVRPGAERPADFDAFWEEAKKKLMGEREDAKCELDSAQSTAQHNVYRISFATTGNRRVYGWLSVPNGPEGLKYPVVVQVAAAGFGAWTVKPIRKPGWIGAFFAVYDFPPEVDFKQDVAKYEKLNADAKAKYGTDRYCTAGIGSSREECFFYPVWLGINRAVDWIARRPDVDLARFTYVGESQGGGSGFALCALNTHFTRAVFQVPALTDLLAFRDGGRQSGWPKMVESQATDEAKANAERFAPYFDAASFAPSIRIPVRVLVGFSDPICPAPCVYAAYNALGSKDKAIFDGLGDSHNTDSHGYRGQLEKWRQEIPPAASSTVGP